MKQENDVRRMKGSSGSCWNVWRMIRKHKGSLTNKDKSTTDSDNLLKSTHEKYKSWKLQSVAAVAPVDETLRGKLEKRGSMCGQLLRVKDTHNNHQKFKK